MKQILEITKALHLLYVEDNEQVRISSLAFFQNFFDQITTANDGLEALEKYQEGTVDLVITDLSMPNMDGIELIQNIRRQDPKMPIIVYSAWNDPSYMTACIALNVDGYLLKPMQSKNLIEVLEKVSQRILHAPKDQLQGEVLKLKIRQKKEEMTERFNVDKLTRLKSSNVLLEQIENTQSRNIPVMILINIDAFHIYNKLYGLSIGDAILVKFANNLKTFSKELPYELYRMSGDEFVLFEKVKALDSDRYEQEIEALFDYIDANPIFIDGIQEPIVPAITVGVSFNRENSYGKANMTLYEARRRGRRYLGFSVEADRRRELQNNLYWREEINQALSQHRVHAFYHAIVDADKKILKYESLIRIKQSQDNGTVKVVAPSEFLDFSKTSKQYISLTMVMIEASFKTMLEENVHIAINLTHHDIENREINKLLRERISKHHLVSKTEFDISSQVIFELLQHPNHDDFDRFVAFIDEFKALGVLITIDNFGLGFSNMSKITSLTPHYVKIDSTLMKNIDTDRHAYQLVKAIVKFAQELGIKTIAGHVSTEAIFEKSKELGIDEFQGYYFGKPVECIESEEGWDR